MTLGLPAFIWLLSNIVLASLLPPSAFAQTTQVNEFLTHPIARKLRNVIRDDEAVKISGPQNTALSQALSRAWKRDFIEDGIEETKNTLLQCQRETSVVLTTPLGRSDAQQSHCSRF